MPRLRTTPLERTARLQSTGGRLGERAGAYLVLVKLRVVDAVLRDTLGIHQCFQVDLIGQWTFGFCFEHAFLAKIRHDRVGMFERTLHQRALIDLGGGFTSQPQVDTTFQSPYTYDPNGVHLYLLVVKRQAVKLNAIKVKYSDHNKKYLEH